jgi:hypothetical protein
MTVLALRVVAMGVVVMRVVAMKDMAMRVDNAAMHSWINGHPSTFLCPSYTI